MISVGPFPLWPFPDSVSGRLGGSVGCAVPRESSRAARASPWLSSVINILLHGPGCLILEHWGVTIPRDTALPPASRWLQSHQTPCQGIQLG